MTPCRGRCGGKFFRLCAKKQHKCKKGLFSWSLFNHIFLGNCTGATRMVRGKPAPSAATSPKTYQEGRNSSRSHIPNVMPEKKNIVQMANFIAQQERNPMVAAASNYGVLTRRAIENFKHAGPLPADVSEDYFYDYKHWATERVVLHRQWKPISAVNPFPGSRRTSFGDINAQPILKNIMYICKG